MMSIAMIVMLMAVAIVAALFIVMIAGAVNARREKPKRIPEIHLNAARDEELQDYLERDMVINAIKRYRELTGASLVDARDAVLYIRDNPEAVAKKRRPHIASDAGVRDLLRSGQRREAIELYQAFAGVDFFSARSAVEAIEAEIAAEASTDHMASGAIYTEDDDFGLDAYAHDDDEDTMARS